jgi:hypothetical protein
VDSGRLRRALAAVTLLCAAHPERLWACAACYGASDSPMAKGMNWGIFSLLGVIGAVLIGVASFFIFLASRSASGTGAPAASPARGRAEAKPTVADAPQPVFSNGALGGRSC